MARQNSLQIGYEFSKAVQNFGGVMKFQASVGISTETIKRWMKVGPANVHEVIEAEDALLKAGLSQDEVHRVLRIEIVTPQPTRVLAQIRSEATQPTRKPHIRHDDQWVDIPVYDVRAAAGEGYQNGQAEMSSEVRLSPDHIRQVLGVPPESLAVIRVEGDSMTPLMHHGDSIFIDTRPPATITEGVYLFRQDDALLVKQLQRVLGGIQVSSRNPAYASYNITNENATGFQVIGRVVGKCGRI
jgi:phage repressor protein C with HTH and peptisase S24 domain